MCVAVCVVKPLTLSSTLTRPNGSSNSRRVFLVISPSLRVGPASFARGSRRTRQEAALLTPSPLRSSSSVPLRSSPSRDSRPICCRSGHSPASLVACRSDASWHLHSAPPSARKDRPCARHLVACAPARTVELERVVQHQRVLHQRSQPRRTTCPPQRSSSSRFRAMCSRPEPVR